MKVYLNDDKTHVDPQPHNDILWGLKAHCDMLWCHGRAYKDWGLNSKLTKIMGTIWQLSNWWVLEHNMLGLPGISGSEAILKIRLEF